MTNEMLKLRTEKTFIKKVCDRQSPAVQAALIEIASKMACSSNIITESDTLDTLLSAYDLYDKPEVTGLLGAGPQFVEETIGYATDFNDEFARAVTYQSEKANLDAYYRAVYEKHSKLESTLKDEKKGTL